MFFTKVIHSSSYYYRYYLLQSTKLFWGGWLTLTITCQLCYLKIDKPTWDPTDSGYVYLVSTFPVVTPGQSRTIQALTRLKGIQVLASWLL
jgi:hypothetical protein